MKELEQFYQRFDDPVNSCLLALRNIILEQDNQVASVWKYGMPFFCYKGKMFCYLWVHKKQRKPYLGIVDGDAMPHPELLKENRSRMKILLIDPGQDIPLDLVVSILTHALDLYRKGVTQIK